MRLQGILPSLLHQRNPSNIAAFPSLRSYPCASFPLSFLPHPAQVFDKTKLSWMNGQHLRSLPEEAMTEMVGGRWAATGLLARADSPFVAAALALVQNSLELVAGEVLAPHERGHARGWRQLVAWSDPVPCLLARLAT